MQVKSSRVLNQGYLPYCILFADQSVFETLSNTTLPDGSWQTILDLSQKYLYAPGTTAMFFEGLKKEGLNGFKIADWKLISDSEIKSYLDKGLPVIADFKDIFGYQWHTCVIEGYTDTEYIIKNSWGVEWGDKGYGNIPQTTPMLQRYVAIPITESKGYSGWVQFAPLDKMVITQPYGKTAFAMANPALYKAFGGIHPGWDLEAGIGTNVYSAEDSCTVTFSGYDNGWGNCIKTLEGNRSIIYAHLNDACVNVGDRLTRNQLIGHSGNTGNSTGPHLHYGIYLTDLGGWVDPYGYPITNIPR